jgi:NADH-ubiquinone oxidoreductase chain 5
MSIVLLVLVLPFLASAITLLFGRYLGKTGAIFITIPAVLSAFLISLYSFYNIGLGHKVIEVVGFPWIKSGFFSVSWGFLFDPLTVVMLIVVTSISTMVHIYSVDYMGQDPHFVRFMSYLSLFTFFMLVLVTSNNFLQLFLGWEGVGLASYLLINFWFTRVQANKSAIKAMLMNRVGDFFLGLGVGFVFYTFKTVDFGAVFALVPLVSSTTIGLFFFEVDKLTLIGVCLFLGAVGKSAQLGLHTWLPDAMEGPTPVSALIHAATMVTAGVFLLIRSSPLLEYTLGLLNFIMVVAALTAVFASTVGMFQNDLKRVIAFSTTSQLGYMVLACSLSSYGVALFHLSNHAFFKALLFLSSGAVIHAVADEQDMRKMGGLVKLLPFVHVCILIGSLALAGAPFLSGFYSKDAILELAYANYSAVFGHWFGTLATFFTAFYSVRLLYLTFYASPNGYRSVIFNASEVSYIMFVPLVVLIFGSIFVGYLSRDMFIGLGTDFWGTSIFVLPHHGFLFQSEFIPLFVKLLPTFFSLAGVLVSVLVYMVYYGYSVALFNNSLGRLVYVFFNKRWLFDLFYSEFFARPFLRFGYFITFRLLDRGLIEWVGPYGLVKIVNLISQKVAALGSGYIYHYFAVSFLGFGVLAFLFWIGLDFSVVVVLFFISVVYPYLRGLIASNR